MTDDGRFTSREWGIVVPLSFAAFYENYDYALLSIGAPVISDGLGVSSSTFGLAVSVIRLFGLAAVVLVSLADRVGRRTMLLATLVGLGVSTALTAGAWGLVSFVAFASLSRVFLSAEGTMSVLVIAEEVHPTRRGRAVSISGFVGQTGFGAVALLIAIVPLVAVGWRLLYLFALGPLVLVAWLRRRLPETRAFDVAADEDRLRGAGRRGIPRRWWGRVAACLAVFGAVGAFQTASVFHAAELAQDTYDWTGWYTLIIVASGVFTLAGFVVGGRGSDARGRRPMIALGIVIEVVGMAVLFLGGQAAYAPGWFAFVFGQAVIAGCWLAFVAELVPTEVRAAVTSIVVAFTVAGGSFGLAVSSALGDTPRSAGSVTVWIGLAGIATLPVLFGLPEAGGRDMVGTYDAEV